MFEMKDIKNIELPLENCKICGTPTNPCDMVFIPPRSKICNKCCSIFYIKVVSRMAYENAEKEAKEKGLIRVKLDLSKLPRTNFDKITESVESLAEFIINNTSNCYHCVLGIDGKCKSALKFLGEEICKKEIIEWLQEECE